jgi:hypothetical protein
MHYLNLIGEIKQNDFETILTWALESCTHFSLAWRTDWEGEDTANELYHKLLPFFVRDEDTDEWPGTKIFNATATIAYYKLSAESIEILKKVHLFGLGMPFYPEDLALYKDDGSCWFGSVAHEQMAFFADMSLTKEIIKSRLHDIDVEIIEE